MKKFIFLMVIASLSACTSTPKLTENGDPVPPSRLYGYSKKSDAQLVVIHDSVLEGGCMIRLSIDGKPAADFFNGEIAYFGLTMGTHKLVARPLTKCKKSELSEEAINVKAGDALLRRIAGTTIQSIPLPSQ
jgi:hypothetical protein